MKKLVPYALAFVLGGAAMLAAVGFCLSAAWGQTAAATPGPEATITADWVGWQVHYLCDANGARLTSWLDWVGTVAVVPCLAQIIKNLRRWFPGIDSVKILNLLALHFLDPKDPQGIVPLGKQP